MTREEAIRQTEQENTLLALGFTREEAEQLRRISMTLHRWHEMECGVGNGCVEVDDDGKAYWHNSMSGRRYPMPNRGAGAERRLKRIVAARNARQNDAIRPYIQGDPRGAALYILRPDDSPIGKEDGYYTRGIVVY